jgi:Secretion system C-terminal sorting domain
MCKFLFILLTPFFLFAQYPKIIDMQGLTDSEGATWLVYKANLSFAQTPLNKFGSDIHYFNPESKEDSLMFSTLIFSDTIGVPGYGDYAGLLAFWDNDPFKYLRFASGFGSDSWMFLEKYNSEGSIFELFGAPYVDERIIISKNSPENIYFNNSQTSYFSADSGRNTQLFNDSLLILNVNPFDKNLIYTTGYNRLLRITPDHGTSYFIADSSYNWGSNAELHFDKDHKHVYAVLNNPTENLVLVSADSGKAGSWGQIYRIENDWRPIQNISLTVNDSIPGEIYINDRSKILKSSDYGQTFEEIIQARSHIRGLYKMPADGSLFYATAYRIYEYKNNTSQSIKKIWDDYLPDFFPLKIGDKWVYKVSSLPDSASQYELVRKVVDSVLFDSLTFMKLYEKSSNGQISKYRYLRYDTVQNKIFEYLDGPNPVIIELFDLETIPGDLIYNSESIGSQNFEKVVKEEWLLQNVTSRYYTLSNVFYPDYYTLAQGIGIVAQSGGSEFTPLNYSIKGAAINGVVYGDTSVKNLHFYPLKNGNYWVYENEYSNVFIQKYFFSIEVTGDTLLSNKSYKILKYQSVNNNNYYYERIDSSSGFVYRYEPGCDSTNERKLYLLAPNTIDIEEKCSPFTVTNFLRDTSNIFGTNRRKIKYEGQMYMDRYDQVSFIENIGMLERHYNLSDGSTGDRLQGAVINGVVYGDTTITAIKENSVKPNIFALSQNYPNPFNPQTEISYNLAQNSFVKLTIFDVNGREVKTLLSKRQSAGQHTVLFKADNLASGIYYYRIKAGSFIETKKMVLLR